MRKALFLLLWAVPLLCNAQPIQEKVDVQLVNVYLSATDSHGRFITDLTLEELALVDDGIPQQITHFTNFAADAADTPAERVPLTLAFVIDSSASMTDRIGGQQKMDIIRSAAFRLTDELRDEDQVMLVSFNEYPDLVTPLTTDRKKFVQDLLFQDVEGGNTALLDAIYFAMDKLKDTWGRKIIVVCSDGEDTASYLQFDEVLSNLIASDITVLAFGTMALTSASLRGRYVLEKMAEASGGYAFFPTSMKSLEEAMERLRQGMRSQYSLGYSPSRLRKDNAWHKIHLRCTRPGLKLRYREGYHE